LKSDLIPGLLLILTLTACSGLDVVQESPSIPPIASESPVIKVLTPKATEDSPQNNLTRTPDPTIISTPEVDDSCRNEIGLVQPFKILNARTGEEITGRIYTPPCYRAGLEQEYPTLYLLHGDTASDQQWDDLGIDELADTLIARGDIPPLIIIMPKEDTWISLPENPFGDQVVIDLIPWVDKNYQTATDRKYRAIGGVSRGGNWAVRIGFLHWGLFGSVGAHSTPLFFGDLNRLPGWFEIIPASKIPRIYLDIGQDDNDQEDAMAFEMKLSDLEIPHTWRLFPGLHEESYWKAHLEEYLLWYSTGWN